MKRKRIVNENSGNFYDRLKYVRWQLGYTQDEFSQFLNISKPTLVRYEAGGRKPDADFLHILMTRFNININWLISGNGKMFLSGGEITRNMGIELDDESVHLLALMKIPEIKRSVIAQIDQLKFIFKPLVDEYLAQAKDAETSEAGGQS